MNLSEYEDIHRLEENLSRHRRETAAISPLHFADMYLRHHFTLAPSRMHLELFEMLDVATQKRNKRIAIAAPRGHAKSTVVTLAYVLYSILLGHEQHVLLLSATSEQAEQYLLNIKHEIQCNDLLMRDFPELCHPAGSKNLPRPWTRNKILLGNNTMVRALGCGQSIRGIKHQQSRPTLILVDDLENHDDCFSADQRQKTRDWFYKVLLKAGYSRTNVLVVGTIVHYDAILANLTYPSPAKGKGVSWASKIYQAIESFASRSDLWDKWESIRFGQSDYHGEIGEKPSEEFFNDNKEAMLQGTQVLWPENEDYYQLMVMRADEGIISFQSEKQNEPLDPEQCIFTESSIKYWDDTYQDVAELLNSLGPNVAFYGACDPSMGRRANRGDYTAIITLVKDTDTNKMYVIGANLARRKPADTIEQIVVLGQTYRYSEFAFESNQFQEVMADQLRDRLRLAGVSMYPKSVNNATNKQTRIESLEPLITSGKLMFCRKHQLLLEQLRQFPMGAHDDGPDALEMAVTEANQENYSFSSVSMF